MLDRFAAWVQAIRFVVEKPGMEKVKAWRHGQVNVFRWMFPCIRTLLARFCELFGQDDARAYDLRGVGHPSVFASALLAQSS